VVRRRRNMPKAEEPEQVRYECKVLGCKVIKVVSWRGDIEIERRGVG